jgi:hypothetical protein
MPKGEDTRHHGARIVSLDAHRAKKAKPSMMSRIKDAMIGGPGNPDLDDPNTPEYTGQEARLSDIAPRNLIDKAKGGTGRVEKKPLFSWDENNNPSFRGKPIK